MTDYRVAKETVELVKTIGDVAGVVVTTKFTTPYYDYSKYDGQIIFTQYDGGGDAKYIGFDLKDIDDLIGFLTQIKTEADEVRQRGFPDKIIG